MADKTKLATFKIDEDQWKAFQAKAGNASAVLKDFIAAYLDDQINILPDGSIDTNSGLDDRIEATIDRVLSERLSEVNDRLGKLINA